MGRRKNASFTLDQTYGSGHGDRAVIEVFYDRLNELYPGNTPIPIPPESQVHPKHDAATQKFIFADYAVRKIAALAVGYIWQGKKLEMLEPITDENTAYTARLAAEAAAAVFADGVGEAAAARLAAEAAARAARDAQTTASVDPYWHDPHNYAAYCAADAAHFAAKATARRKGDAIWNIVNEMLQAL